MPYKQVDFSEGWNIQIGSNEVSKWSRNSYAPSTYGGHKPTFYLNIKDSDMKELYKCPKFKEIVEDTFIEELILGQYPKGWKTPEQLQEEIKKNPKWIPDSEED